jgi:uncharacterized protein YbcI
MTTSLKTRGHTQRTLAQQIQKLYKKQIGHTPGKVTCQIADNTITVIAEDSLTKLEQLLIDGEKENLASMEIDVEEVRSGVEVAIRPLLIEMLQEILSIDVIDVLSDTTLETGRTAIVAILSEAPAFA